MRREAASDLIVYEHSESVCCHKVRIVLAEKGLTYVKRIIALEQSEQVSDEYLEINSKGVVPVVVHNGRKIFESSIITEYLDDAFPNVPLMPTDPYWRAKRRLWARWIDDEMHVPHMAKISFIVSFHQAFRKELDTQRKLNQYLEKIPGKAHRETMRASFSSGVDSEQMRESIWSFDKFIQCLDEQLSETSWLAGPTYSLADIDVVPYIWRLRNLQLSGIWKDRPRVQDWLERVTARIAFKEAVIDLASPDWLALMESSGKEAWPTIEKMLPQNA